MAANLAPLRRRRLAAIEGVEDAHSAVSDGLEPAHLRPVATLPRPDSARLPPQG